MFAPRWWLVAASALFAQGCGLSRQLDVEACEPDCEVLAGGLGWIDPLNFAVDEGAAYAAPRGGGLASDGDVLYELRPNQKPAVVFVVESASALAVRGGRAYWSDTVAERSIHSVALDGSDPRTHFTRRALLPGFQLDEQSLYVETAGDEPLWRVPLDGGKASPYDEAWRITSATLDGDALYFSARGLVSSVESGVSAPCELRRQPLAGGPSSLLYTSTPTSREPTAFHACETDSVVAFDGALYWVDNGAGLAERSLRTLPEQGGEPRTLLDGIVEGGTRFAADSENAYVGATLADGRSGIFRVPLSGAEPTLLLRGAPVAVLVDATHLFFLRGARGESTEVVRTRK